ncbi:hypothetical protein LPW11_08150 [Geomonas sp. RF6]|uniref:hypothetical protein n=1 Tax=Geomonas sp. RF6 TaxID=2897342 RepID=UPI001E55DD07|nr:hypothetical protein [Geomonas sp. RF6]UFS72151.1 hypothetical protein LPW11_08150 [Geomonas sp. RF6]
MIFFFARVTVVDSLIKITIGILLLAFWGVLLLQQHYSDEKIESLVKNDVQQSYRKRNLFLRDVDVKILDKGSLTSRNELPIKVHVKYEPPYSGEDAARTPVSKTVDLFVSKNDSGEMVIKSRQGVDLCEVKEINVL